MVSRMVKYKREVENLHNICMQWLCWDSYCERVVDNELIEFNNLAKRNSFTSLSKRMKESISNRIVNSGALFFCVKTQSHITDGVKYFCYGCVYQMNKVNALEKVIDPREPKEVYFVKYSLVHMENLTCIDMLQCSVCKVKLLRLIYSHKCDFCKWHLCENATTYLETLETQYKLIPM